MQKCGAFLSQMQKITIPKIFFASCKLLFFNRLKGLGVKKQKIFNIYQFSKKQFCKKKYYLLLLM